MEGPKSTDRVYGCSTIWHYRVDLTQPWKQSKSLNLVRWLGELPNWNESVAYCRVGPIKTEKRPRVQREPTASFPFKLLEWPRTNANAVRKTILKLPDLEQSKSAVLNSLTSTSSQRSYDNAIRAFIDWYCSEPRLAFNKTVVTRYRISLEQANYASSTINPPSGGGPPACVRGRRLRATKSRSGMWNLAG